MNFFTSPNDLRKWVLGKKDPNIATQQILDVVGDEEALSIKQGCDSIFNLNSEIKKEEKETHFSKELEDASGILFSVLSKYNITEMKKTSEVNLMNKKLEKFNTLDFPIREAQVTRPPSSPYTGREDDNKYVGTPWRRDRDAMYDFTHRNPDMLSFDDDPQRVYSGEALWRRYIMDKFYRNYKDEKGRVVGGFINDRFKVFHDMGGNQMELADGERTRKPRPHQYSIERRLEEARDQKTEDILPLRSAAGDTRIIITGSEENPAKSEDIKYVASDEDGFIDIPLTDAYKEEDTVAKAFVDVLDMHEAGVNDKDIILKISKHYKIPIARVAQIKDFAYKTKSERKGLLYACDGLKMSKKAAVNEEGQQLIDRTMLTVTDGQGNILGAEEKLQDTLLQEVGLDQVGNRLFVVKDMDANVEDSTKLMFPQNNPDSFLKDLGADEAMRELEGVQAEQEMQEQSMDQGVEQSMGQNMDQGTEQGMNAAASSNNDFPIKEV